VTINQGKKAIPADKKPDPNSVQEKPIKIFNKACPLIMFANNRILRLKTLAKKDINSIGIKIGAIAKGTPLGKNKLKNSHRCSMSPIIFIPTKWVNAKKNVTTKELVNVNE
jgi:hypothetical protein